MKEPPPGRSQLASAEPNSSCPMKTKKKAVSEYKNVGSHRVKYFLYAQPLIKLGHTEQVIYDIHT